MAINPLCTISVRLPGIDLILDGTAATVTVPGMLEQVAAGYHAGGWPARVDGDAFSALSAGPPHRGRRRDQRAVRRDPLAPPALAAVAEQKDPPWPVPVLACGSGRREGCVLGVTELVAAS